jgi:hypothetical protein
MKRRRGEGLHALGLAVGAMLLKHWCLDVLWMLLLLGLQLRALGRAKEGGSRSRGWR